MCPTPEKPIAIVGAGAIGCYVGGHWSDAGLPISMICRPGMLRHLENQELRLSGNSESISIKASQLHLTADTDKLRHASAVVLAIKSTALDQSIRELKQYVGPDIPIISLLNGLMPVRRLRAALPHNPIIAAMVPFNVVWRNETHLHRSSKGQMVLANHPVSEAISKLVSDSDVPVELSDDIEAIQYGKLLLNLINPVNALAGLSLHKTLSDRGFRRIYANLLTEALAIYEKADVQFIKSGPFHPKLGAKILATPNLFFNLVILRVQQIDANSMTSMAADYQNGKPCEIDALNGEIVRLAEKAHTTAPLNQAITDLVRQELVGKRTTYESNDLLKKLNDMALKAK